MMKAPILTNCYEDARTTMCITQGSHSVQALHEDPSRRILLLVLHHSSGPARSAVLAGLLLVAGLLPLIFTPFSKRPLLVKDAAFWKWARLLQMLGIRGTGCLPEQSLRSRVSGSRASQKERTFR